MTIMRKMVVLFLLAFSIAWAAYGQRDAEQQNDGQKEYDQGVVIKKKPLPQYSDQARHAGLQGTIRLKVTFNADETLGEIVYDSESAYINGKATKKKLFAKYGLLEKSIEAARKIKFTPAMKDGRPVTVTKIIYYNFAMY